MLLPKIVRLILGILAAQAVLLWMVDTSEAAADQVVLSLDARNDSLGNVLNKLAESSGYRIEFNRKWSDYPVNVRIKDESLDDALKRVLNDFNYAIVWDERAKIVTLFIYGATEPGTQPRGYAGSTPDAAPVGPRPQAASPPSPPSGEAGFQPSLREKRAQGSGGGRRSGPAPMTGPSVSGGDVRFDQATSTIVE